MVAPFANKPVPPKPGAAPVPPKAPTSASSSDRKSRIEYTPEMLEYITQNAKTKKTTELSAALGITNIQVNAMKKNIIKSLRSKLSKKSKLEMSTLYGVTTDRKGNQTSDFSNPIHELSQKLEAKIDATFGKVERDKSDKTNSASKKAINGLVDKWFEEL